MNQYKIHPLPDGKKNKKPTKKPNKKKNSKKTGKNRGGKVLTAGRIVLLTFLSLLLVLFLSANIFLYVYKPPINLDEDLYEDLEDEFLLFVPDDGEGEGEVNPSADLSRKSDCYTFLILGVDRGSTLTDTMMIAIFDIKENTISILNIPRDTYVSTKNYSGLINGVYGRGRTNAAKTGSVGDEIAKEGIKYLNAMLKYTFGIPIDKYVLINLDGFKFLVDKIGGVEFEVPFRMKYTDPDQNLYIDLQPGLQTLYGKEAEQLIRFRHGDDGYGGYGRTINGVFYPSEDIGRIQTQQRFIAAILKKMLGKPDVNTIKTLFELGDEYMLSNMSIGDVGWFATKLTSARLENIRTHTVPTNWISSIGRLEAYKAETVEIINKYYNPYKNDIPEKNFNVYDKDLAGLAKPEINIDGNTLDGLVK